MSERRSGGKTKDEWGQILRWLDEHNATGIDGTEGDGVDVIYALIWFAEQADGTPPALIDRARAALKRLDSGSAKSLDQAFQWSRPGWWRRNSEERTFQMLRVIVMEEVATRTFGPDGVGRTDDLFDAIAESLSPEVLGALNIGRATISGRTVKRIWLRARREEAAYRKQFPRAPSIMDLAYDADPAWVERAARSIGAPLPRKLTAANSPAWKNHLAKLFED